jgi:hypothetical protein
VQTSNANSSIDVVLSQGNKSMRRFVLHIKDGSTIIPDEEGTDLPNFEAAKRYALKCARCMLADAVRAGEPTGGLSDSR